MILSLTDSTRSHFTCSQIRHPATSHHRSLTPATFLFLRNLAAKLPSMPPTMTLMKKKMKFERKAGSLLILIQITWWLRDCKDHKHRPPDRYAYKSSNSCIHTKGILIKSSLVTGYHQKNRHHMKKSMMNPTPANGPY